MINRVVAFDLDGTLSQSEKYLVPSYRDSARELGLESRPDSLLMQMIGGTLDDNLEIMMPGQTMEEFMVFIRGVNRHTKEYAEKYGETYPHIPESLEELRRRGYKIALCSNGDEGYISFILDTLGISRYFDLIQPNIPGWNKAQLLEKIMKDFDTKSVVMVGDRHFDETAARVNGVPFIGCAYGLFPQEVTKADVVIQDAAELPKAVDRLIGSGV